MVGLALSLVILGNLRCCQMLRSMSLSSFDNLRPWSMEACQHQIYMDLSGTKCAYSGRVQLLPYAKIELLITFGDTATGKLYHVHMGEFARRVQ